MPLIIPSPLNGKEPQIHDSVFIAPNATIIGDVIIEEGSNIWFGTVQLFLKIFFSNLSI